MSCSSEMSPTISSRISSSVTSPSTSPYSSTTSAKWVLRRRNALSCSDSGRMSGTNQGGSAIAMTSISPRSPSAFFSARSRSLACRMPTMFSGLSRHSGMRVKPDLSTALTISSGGSSALTVVISVRWTMTSDTVRSRRSSNPPIMSRSSFSTLPSRCNRSTVPRISSCGARIDCSSPIRHAEQAQDLAHQPFDRHQHRAEHADHQCHRPRRHQRHAVGRVEGDGLRQHLGEHHDQHRHQRGGIDHADVAEPDQEHAGRQRRGQDVDRVVAEQQRADQPLARRQQAVDDAGVAIAVLSQPQHRWRATMRSARFRCRRRKTTAAGRAGWRRARASLRESSSRR